MICIWHVYSTSEVLLQKFKKLDFGAVSVLGLMKSCLNLSATTDPHAYSVSKDGFYLHFIEDTPDNTAYSGLTKPFPPGDTGSALQ